MFISQQTEPEPTQKKNFWRKFEKKKFPTWINFVANVIEIRKTKKNGTFFSRIFKKNGKNMQNFSKKCDKQPEEPMGCITYLFG